MREIESNGKPLTYFPKGYLELFANTKLNRCFARKLPSVCRYPLRLLPEDIGEPIDTSLRRLPDDMVRVSLAEIPLTSIRF
jgi:hypothetical protein